MSIRGTVSLSVLLIFVPIALVGAEDENYVRCREGRSECKPSLLTAEQRRMVKIYASGRNAAACAAQEPSCDPAKLTAVQVATLQKIARDEDAARRAAILDAGRNLAACAYRQAGCDVTQLTPEQIENIRQMEWPPASTVVPEAPRIETARDDASRRREAWKRFGKGLLTTLGEIAEAYVAVETARVLMAEDDAVPIIVSSSSSSGSTPEARVATAKSCTSDFQCRYGEQCVKPAGSITFKGTCVQPVNQYGLKVFEIPKPSVGPREVPGCSFTTDCAIGFKCVKKPGQLEGLCIKK